LVEVPTDAFEELRSAAARGDAAAAQCAIEALKESGTVKRFASQVDQLLIPGREITLEDLRTVGIIEPTRLAQEASSSDSELNAALLLAVGGSAAAFLLQGQAETASLAPALGLASLAAAVGVLAPQTLSEVGGSEVQRRATAHEAAHFLVGYLLGAHIRAYSVDATGTPRVEFDDRTGPLAGANLSEEALGAYCAVACAGIAGEGLLFKGALGGAEDLKALDLLLQQVPSASRLREAREQINFTRWGVLRAASMLQANRASWEALQEAMRSGADLCGCVRAIEDAA